MNAVQHKYAGHKPKRPRWPIPLAAIASLLLIGLFAWSEFQAVGDGWALEKFGPYSREIGESAPHVSIEEILKSRDSYRNGNGFRVPFYKTRNGYPIDSLVVVLPAWKKFQEEGNQDRRWNAVDVAFKRLHSAREWFVDPLFDHPFTWTYAIVVDDTDPVNDRLVFQVKRQVDELNFASKLDAGDGLELYFFVISDHKWSDDKLLRISRGLDEDGQANALSEINAHIESLLYSDDDELKAGTASSEVATGLFAALRELEGTNAEVLVFSDGEHRSGEIFFPNIFRRSLKQNEIKDLRSKLAPKDLPNLKGIAIRWFKFKKDSETMDNSVEFWAEWMRDLGAASVDVK